MNKQDLILAVAAACGSTTADADNPMAISAAA